MTNESQKSQIMAEWRSIRIGHPIVDQMGVFEAYSQDDDWNGWLVPAFTREAGQRVAAWTWAHSEHLPDREVEIVKWDEQRQAFLLVDAEGEEEIVDGFWVPELKEALFGIGANRWIWEPVAQEN